MKLFFRLTMLRVAILFIAILILIDCVGLSVAADGFVAYRSNTGTDATNSPKIRYWNNTANGGAGSWSSEVGLTSAGSPIRNIVLKQSPVSSKIVIVTQSDDGNLDGYVCMKRCDIASNWNYSSNIGNVGTANQRMFDLSFEYATGDLLLVYSVVNTNTANDLAYQVLSEANISFDGLTEQYIDDTGHTNDIQYTWISMDNKPNSSSEEIILAGFDSTNNDINSWVWSGASFGSINSISEGATSTGGYEALVVKYAADGSKGMVAGADGGSGVVNSNYWSGGTWTTVTSFDPIPTGPGQNNDEQWLSMHADPSSDDLQLVMIDSGSRLHTAYWSGSTWTVTAGIDTGVDSTATRVADFSWLGDSTGRLVWDTDDAGTTLSTVVCNPSCTSATQTISTYAGTGAWITLFRNPTVTELVQFIGLRLNSALDIGTFWYNGTGLDYTNYGDNSLTADTTTTVYEAFKFDYRRDLRPPAITFINPSASGIYWMSNTVFVNITSNEYLSVAVLEWNGVNHTMDGADMLWNYTITGMGAGFYSYKVFSTDLSNNSNVSDTWNFTITAPNITLISPDNNTLNNYSRNTTFYFNVTDISGDINRCSLIIDGNYVVNITGNPLSESETHNFTYALSNGQHNWSVWCNDTNNINSTSEVRNITSLIELTLYHISLDDNIAPYGEIMLNAGSTRLVNCSIIVSDPDGPSFIDNASAKLYYYLNSSDDSDDNNVHYTNSDCTVINVTDINKTFSCEFDVLYYANNGTWICNVTVNNQPYSEIYNVSSTILPLYAVNLTDGLNFGDVASEIPSMNITANITNFGNMPLNITLQGYALVIGDNVGMNCSDDTNITITNIRFSADDTANFSQKTPLNGSIQPLNFRIDKQINGTQIFNTTYWQIVPDAGTKDRLCTGYIIFNAQAS